MRSASESRRVPVVDGRSAGRAGADWLYTFSLLFPATLADDAPVILRLEADREHFGQIVSASVSEVTIASSVEIEDNLARASLVQDPSFLIEQLIGRLTLLEEQDCGRALTLFGFDQPRVNGAGSLPDAGAGNAFQLGAVEAATSRDVTYVWGPPGTGKTTTLGLIAQALVDQGERVLLTASTNVAVDNAVLQAGQRPGLAGRVVRYGTPQLVTLRGGAGVAGLPEPRDQRLMATQGLLFEEPVAAPVQSDATPAVTVVPARRARTAGDEAERGRTLRQAAVVATTLSRLAVATELRTPGFEAVVIDEASAAQLPAVFHAAAQARQRVIVLGDPKQLPPVALAEGPLGLRWMRRDVFAQAGLEDDDPRAVLLREQYRMAPAISRLANTLVYGGRLIDATLPDGRRSGVRLVDTSELGARCSRQDGSRVNEVHAALAVELAAELLQEVVGPGARGALRRTHQLSARPVAIISPYRGQARLLWKLVRQARLDRLVDVGTVHSFQGAEREAVIFDLVEAPPERPAPFVAGGAQSEAARLINVAITRARSRLVVVAHVRHLAQWLRPDATAHSLLTMLLEDDA